MERANQFCKQNLLLIEDDQNLLSTMALVLKNAGFKVETAVTVSSARQQLNNKQFDLVLLDLDLDGESGFPLLAEVRTFHSKTKIVILTAQISTDVQKKAMRNGAKGYLVKPIDPQEIIIFVRSLLVNPSA